MERGAGGPRLAHELELLLSVALVDPGPLALERVLPPTPLVRLLRLQPLGRLRAHALGALPDEALPLARDHRAPAPEPPPRALDHDGGLLPAPGLGSHGAVMRLRLLQVVLLQAAVVLLALPARTQELRVRPRFGRYLSARGRLRPHWIRASRKRCKLLVCCSTVARKPHPPRTASAWSTLYLGGELRALLPDASVTLLRTLLQAALPARSRDAGGIRAGLALASAASPEP